MSILILKNKFDLTPKGEIVDCAKIGEHGYAENVEHEIVLTKLTSGDYLIHWYGEDDTEMSLEEYLSKVS
jgi:hypothetical protein